MKDEKMSKLPLNTITEALAALRVGKPVLVLDDENRENEGDAILAASLASPEWLGWMVRYTSGYLCAPLSEARAAALDLPPMVQNNQDPRNTAYTISVDAKVGTTTGISAADRATTARALAKDSARPEDFIRPGHLLPLQAIPGGVLARAGHTEASVDLCRLAGLPEVGVIGELVHDDGSLRRTPDVLALGQEFDLPVITIADLISYRERYDIVKHQVKTVLPTKYGEFQLDAFTDELSGLPIVAISKPWPEAEIPLVRLHSECFTGDILGSYRCDCGEQLDQAMKEISEKGGVLVYLTGHEGRGVGLINKLKAYVEQDHGADTVDAQTNLGLPIDSRDYRAGCAILRQLGIKELRLLTNNPEKITAVRALGLTVEQVVPSWIVPHAENLRYLQTKRDRMGHRLERLDS